MKPYTVVLLGFFGMILALALWTAYADHVLLHQLVDAFNKAIQQAQTAAPK